MHFNLKEKMEEFSMNKSIIEDEIAGYIKRSIPDIARKCNVKDTDVIETFKKIIGK